MLENSDKSGVDSAIDKFMAMLGNSQTSIVELPEAYSQVSNPERFRPLHGVALRLIQQLESSFEVNRFESYEFGIDVPSVGLERPSIQLIPTESTAATLLFAFSAFPGISVRVAEGQTIGFPGCGCDACNESFDEESTRLLELVDSVTEGKFYDGTQKYWSPWQRRKAE